VAAKRKSDDTPIPLSLFFADKEGFLRNYKILLRERPGDRKLLEALADELSAAAAKGVMFRPGRPVGSVSTKTKLVRTHITELMTAHPKLTPSQLFKKRDPNITGRMAKKTFADHVRFLRKNKFPN
jgi:hypothetical protein